VKAKDFVCISLAAGTFAMFAGCGGGSGSSMSATPTPPSSTAPTPMPTAQSLEFQQVRDLSATSSETTDPMAVNGGAVTVTPTDDDVSDPGSVR
jgi:hypothetical protein